MFDNKLVMRRKDDCIEGAVIIGGIAIKATEPIKSNPRVALAKVMDSIVTAAEFFPLKDVVGHDTFVKAVELFVMLKNGTPEQKRKAQAEIKIHLDNSRRKNDPTSQDIDYALARLERQYIAGKFNKEGGPIVVDVLGYSPANLRRNLDMLSVNSEPLRRARELYNELTSKNEQRKQLAKTQVRSIMQRAESGDSPVARAVIEGLKQYLKAHNGFAICEELFGDKNVTVGFSLKAIKRKITPKNVARVTAAIATGGASEAALLAKRKLIDDRRKKAAAAKAAAAKKQIRVAPKRPLVMPNLSQKMPEKEVKPAVDVVPVDDLPMERPDPSGLVEPTGEVEFGPNAEVYEPEPEEMYDEPAYDGEEIIGFSFGSLVKKIATPLAKQLTPLAATAANMIAPGSGALIAKALPALVDAIPGDKKPTPADIAKGLAVVKAADEKNPEALKKIDTIKQLAAQGVPDAENALNALKVAKSVQQVAETVVAAKAGSPLSSAKDGEPIPVKIVAWGK